MSIARNLMFSAVLLTASAWAQQGGDLQAQILYSYQVEDTNRLANLIQNLHNQVAADGADVSLRYHLAHAQYRMGLVAGKRRARVAEIAFGDCIDELKPLIQEDVKSAEALVLQSACYAQLADFKKLEAVLLRSRSGERLKAALDLAPRNPRVVYLAALNGLAQSKPGTPEYQRSFAQLQLAVKLFEESSATNIDAPGWGHAEAYLALGRELQSRGDSLGARNWIEKSLIAAPEYKAAQRQLALLVRP
jgi:tetratricopeptide (TPR) repeat protein